MDWPYIVGPQRCNGWSHPNISLAQITATQWPGAFNGSTTQRLFQPNGKLAVTASSVWESASASFRVALRLTWTHYAPHSSPPTLKSLV
jgi:hypothetical protein